MNAIETLPAEDSRSRLLRAAMEVFAAEGYRVGVDRIAAQAGVAKQTLYNHFPSKGELFSAVIRLAVDELLVTLDDDARDLRARLTDFAVRYREKLLSPVGLGFFCTMVAETRQFPELAQEFYRTGPAQATARLVALLRDAMQRGELRHADPEFAANALLSMLVGAERNRYLFSGETPPVPDPAEARALVDIFLRGFAPAP